LNADFNVSDAIQLTSITAYREWENRFNTDDDLSPSNIGFGQNALDYWFWSQEVRANIQVFDGFDLTVGGYYNDQRTEYFTYQDIRYAVIPLQFIYSPSMTRSTPTAGPCSRPESGLRSKTSRSRRAVATPRSTRTIPSTGQSGRLLQSIPRFADRVVGIYDGEEWTIASASTIASRRRSWSMRPREPASRAAASVRARSIRLRRVASVPRR
jgi:hypothetical protein